MILILVVSVVFASVLVLLGVTIISPWIVANFGEIPTHRAEALTVSVLLTFAHYGTLHLSNKTHELFPIHFLTI